MDVFEKKALEFLSSCTVEYPSLRITPGNRRDFFSKVYFDFSYTIIEKHEGNDIGKFGGASGCVIDRMGLTAYTISWGELWAMEARQTNLIAIFELLKNASTPSA